MMSSSPSRRRIAHCVSNGDRSDDVVGGSIPTFEAMLLSRRTLMGLQKSGFQTPSPIQAKTIPMAKCGVGKCDFYTIIFLTISLLIKSNREVHSLRGVPCRNRQVPCVIIAVMKKDRTFLSGPKTSESLTMSVSSFFVRHDHPG